MNHSEIVSFIWGVADLIRDTFKRGKYQDVILPLTVLRRLDCVLAPTKEKVLARNAELKGKLEDLDPQLRKASGFAFYNTSGYDKMRVVYQAIRSRLTFIFRGAGGRGLNLRVVLGPLGGLGLGGQCRWRNEGTIESKRELVVAVEAGRHKNGRSGLSRRGRAWGARAERCRWLTDEKLRDLVRRLGPPDERHSLAM